jgi:hypothetical protein
MVLTSALALVCASGCNNSPASLRVVNASLDSQALDVAVRATGSSRVVSFSNVAYTQATPYQNITATEYVFELRPAGAPADSTALVTSDPFSLFNGEKVTAVIAGLAGTGDDTAGLQVLIEEERFDLPTDGSGWVSVVNALPDRPDITLTLNTGAAATTTPVTTGTVTRFSATNVLMPVDQSLSVAATSMSGLAPISTSFTATLTSTPAFMIAVGLTTLAPRQDAAFDLLVVGADSSVAIVQQDPFVYALDASPDAPGLDLWNGTTEVAAGVAFGQLTSPLQLPPGDNTIDLFPHSSTNARPAGDPAASLQLSGLQAGQTYLAVASGFAGAGRTPALQGAVYQEAFASMGTPLLRVIQASSDLPKSNMGNAGVTPFALVPDFQNLSFLDSSPAAGTTVPAGFALGVLPVSSSTLLANFALTMGPSTRAFAVTAGATNPQGFDQSFQLLFVDASQVPWAVTAVTPSP